MRLPFLIIALTAFLLPQAAAAEMLSPTDKIVETFMALDFDESTTVSFEEYEMMVVQRMSERFTAMDANGDGEITADEYRKFWVEQKSQFYRPRR